jgi:hypothetical protein
MKRILKSLLYIFLILATVVLILNLKVTTRQGINYQTRTLKIPLYLKLLDFFDRHYNYIELVKRIVKDAKTDEERVMRIFEWTYENVKKTPPGLPIIDDHVWHIVVRGYGARDQFSDIFATLCNYARVKAFYSWIYTKDRSSRIPLSFVKLDKKWCVFDSYNGTYFKDKDGGFASIEDIAKGNWVTNAVSESNKLDFDYSIYLANIPSRIKEGFSRSTIQSPIRRLLFQIKEWLINTN